MSRLILFNNATTVPGATAFGSIAEGRVYAFDADDMGTSLPLGAANSAERIVFVQGGKDGQHIFSPVFNKKDVKTIKAVPYVAPEPQITTVTAEAGAGAASLKITEVSAGFKPHRKFTAEVQLDGKSAADIATEFAEKLNAKAGKFYTVSTSTASIIITANIGVSFETARQEEAQGWSIAVTQTPNFGSGTAEHAMRREKEAWGQQGNFLNRTYLPIPPEGYAEDRTYDFHTFLIPTNTTPNISIGHANLEVTIAAAEDATGINLEDFIKGVPA